MKVVVFNPRGTECVMVRAAKNRVAPPPITLSIDIGVPRCVESSMEIDIGPREALTIAAALVEAAKHVKGWE